MKRIEEMTDKELRAQALWYDCAITTNPRHPKLLQFINALFECDAELRRRDETRIF
jgi:hypothetical protein